MDVHMNISRRAWVWTAVGVASLAGLAGLGGWDSPADSGRTRIGVYDSRAVAIAYGRSAAMARSLEELRTQHEAAKKAGDRAAVKQLEARGEARQIRLHLQAFSTAPVEDCLEVVRDSLPDVARRAGVAVIVSRPDFHDDSVELVDVTAELAALFNPDAKTLEIIAEARKRPPAAIEDIAKVPADQ